MGKWMCILMLGVLFTVTINATTEAPCEDGTQETYLCAAPRNGIGSVRTFNSRCALATFNCQHKSSQYIFKHTGKCPEGSEILDPCFKECPPGKYVCARLKGVGPHITFRSLCEVEQYNCQHPNEDYVVAFEGRCEDRNCHRTCSDTENPVCAVPKHDAKGELKNFKNRCELENYNCDNRESEYQIQHMGYCQIIPPPVITPPPATESPPPLPPLALCGGCPAEHHPVCGSLSSSGIKKTFTSHCELVKYNCVHKTNFLYQHDGDCKKSCNYSCLDIYKPVCAASLRGGTLEKVFNNRCLLDYHNCEARSRQTNDEYEYLYSGECNRTTVIVTTTPPAPSCPRRCDMSVDPVCASSRENPKYSKTFLNECELNNHNCVFPDDMFDFIRKGRCEDINPPQISCIQTCSDEYNPICAAPKDRLSQSVEFNNRCYLDNYNCIHNYSQYEFIKEGNCNATEHPSTPPTLIPSIPSIPSISTCKKSCGADDYPICGVSTYSRTKLTFRSHCEMENYNCDKNLLGTYEYSHDGICKFDVETTPPPTKPTSTCDLTVCSDSYEPVCASPVWGLTFQRTFRSRCLLDKYNCENHLLQYRFVHSGECHFTNSPLMDCRNLQCTQEYLPVCGRSTLFSGLITKTFTNRCMMNVYNCEHVTDRYQFLNNGVCKATTLDPIPVTPLQPGCIKDCECAKKPVCGAPRRGLGPRKTFVNLCKMENYNCENHFDQYELVYEGECEIESTSPRPSPLVKYCIKDCECDYIPVCASPKNKVGSRLTFTNRCKLENHNCEFPNDQYQIEFDGECPKFERIVVKPPSATSVDCMKVCSQAYQPLCAVWRSGISGMTEFKRTFKNMCEFENHNCIFSMSKYELLHGGKCEDTLPPATLVISAVST